MVKILVHQIVSRVQSLIEDESYWSQSRIVTMINQCKDSISEHFGLQTTGYGLFNSVVGQRSYALPVDFVALRLLYWSSGYYLAPENKVSSPDDVLKYTSTPSETGVPTQYYFWGKEDHVELWVWPTFDAVYDVEFWYWRLIPDVAESNDEPLLPRDLHSNIVEYCRRQTWVEDELHGYTPERFDIWWETVLTKMQISKNIQVAGTDQIGPGNFDDRMPAIMEDEVGFAFRVVGTSDGTIW